MATAAHCRLTQMLVSKPCLAIRRWQTIKDVHLRADLLPTMAEETSKKKESFDHAE